MGFGLTRRQMKILAGAPREAKIEAMAKLTPNDVLGFDADFESWAHKAQLPPDGEGWRNWLMMAGRGFGKTRAGAEWVEKLARSRPGVRVALVGATIDEARRVMVEGVSGVLAIAGRNRSQVIWEASLGRLKWPNGSQAQLFSGDNPDGLRGPEHDIAWGAAQARHDGRSGGRGAAVGLPRWTRKRGRPSHSYAPPCANMD